MSDQEDHDRLAEIREEHQRQVYMLGGGAGDEELYEALAMSESEVTRLTQENAEARILCGEALLMTEPDACLATLVNRSRLRAEKAEALCEVFAQENARLKAQIETSRPKFVVRKAPAFFFDPED